MSDSDLDWGDDDDGENEQGGEDDWGDFEEFDATAAAEQADARRLAELAEAPRRVAEAVASIPPLSVRTPALPQR